MELILVCKDCGSAEIQEKAWVSINTGKVIDTIEDESVWCPVCEKQVQPKNSIQVVGEITPEEAVMFWNDKSIFAYDDTQKVDWQINNDNEWRHAYEVIDECIKNGNVIFTE